MKVSFGYMSKRWSNGSHRWLRLSMTSLGVLSAIEVWLLALCSVRLQELTSSQVRSHGVILMVKRVLSTVAARRHSERYSHCRQGAR
jgi:hypothetical protein